MSRRSPTRRRSPELPGRQKKGSRFDLPAVLFSYVDARHEQTVEAVAKVLSEAEGDENTMRLKAKKSLLLLARDGLLFDPKHLFLIALHDDAKMSAARPFPAIADESVWQE